ncbi:hypothetical protein JCM15124A_11680 [Prevotella falsenii]
MHKVSYKVCYKVIKGMGSHILDFHPIAPAFLVLYSESREQKYKYFLKDYFSDNLLAVSAL